MAPKRFFIITLLFLAGCASSPVNLSEMQPLPPDEGIAFGRVRVTEGGKEEKLLLLGESKFSLIILPDASSNAISVPLKEDGSFFWHLPAGGYTIASFEWHRYGITQGRIFAHFVVDKNKATYIGTLTLSFAGPRYTMSIADEYQTSSIVFKVRFPDRKEEIARNLMQMEERR